VEVNRTQRAADHPGSVARRLAAAALRSRSAQVGPLVQAVLRRLESYEPPQPADGIVEHILMDPDKKILEDLVFHVPVIPASEILPEELEEALKGPTRHGETHIHPLLDGKVPSYIPSRLRMVMTAVETLVKHPERGLETRGWAIEPEGLVLKVAPPRELVAQVWRDLLGVDILERSKASIVSRDDLLKIPLKYRALFLLYRRGHSKNQLKEWFESKEEKIGFDERAWPEILKFLEITNEDPATWPEVDEVLQSIGNEDLIGVLTENVSKKRSVELLGPSSPIDERELTALRLLATGQNDQQIASQLGITPRYWVTEIMQRIELKLEIWQRERPRGAARRKELIAAAVKAGVLSPDDVHLRLS